MGTTPRPTKSRLSTYIDAKAREKGIENDTELAERAGIRRSVLSYWRNTPDVAPYKRILKKVADVLGVPVEILQALSGPPDPAEPAADGKEATVADVDPTTLELLRTLPGLAGLTHIVAQLDQADREELLAIARMKLERRGVTR